MSTHHLVITTREGADLTDDNVVRFAEMLYLAGSFYDRAGARIRVLDATAHRVADLNRGHLRVAGGAMTPLDGMWSTAASRVLRDLFAMRAARGSDINAVTPQPPRLSELYPEVANQAMTAALPSDVAELLIAAIDETDLRRSPPTSDGAVVDADLILAAASSEQRQRLTHDLVNAMHPADCECGDCVGWFDLIEPARIRIHALAGADLRGILSTRNMGLLHNHDDTHWHRVGTRSLYVRLRNLAIGGPTNYDEESIEYVADHYCDECEDVTDNIYGSCTSCIDENYDWEGPRSLDELDLPPHLISHFRPRRGRRRAPTPPPSPVDPGRIPALMRDTVQAVADNIIEEGTWVEP